MRCARIVRATIDSAASRRVEEPGLSEAERRLYFPCHARVSHISTLLGDVGHRLLRFTQKSQPGCTVQWRRGLCGAGPDRAPDSPMARSDALGFPVRQRDRFVSAAFRPQVSFAAFAFLARRSGPVEPLARRNDGSIPIREENHHAGIRRSCFHRRCTWSE